MDEHRGLEISICEHPGDVTQVHSDLIATCSISDTVCVYFDGTAISEQSEMMCGLGVIEAHHMITALIHLFSGHVAHVVRFVVLWLLLSINDQGNRRYRGHCSC